MQAFRPQVIHTFVRPHHSLTRTIFASREMPHVPTGIRFFALALLAVLAGVSFVTQATMNSALRSSLGSPSWAAGHIHRPTPARHCHAGAHRAGRAAMSECGAGYRGGMPGG
jgi:hypothetical protein